MNTYHKPVMVTEALEGLDVGEGKKYIDATVGGGGHSIEILKRGGKVLGIDQDPEAVEFTKENKDWKIVQGNFRDIEKIAKEHGFEGADGVLFDLGVSSHQLNTGRRGFSYRFPEAPIDLRMNQAEGISASEIVQQATSEELYEIFARYGEEKLARSIADRIVRARRIAPIGTVGDLVRVLEEVVRDARARPATYSRVFQGLRIAVNDELSALREGVQGSAATIHTGGRIAVISYHSLEDRIVKLAISRLGLRPVSKKPIVPSPEEVARNPRGRSAKLRIAEKL